MRVLFVWSDLKASMSRSTFWASPWTRMWFWNFLRASSSSMLWKSISSTTQLRGKTIHGTKMTGCSQISHFMCGNSQFLIAWFVHLIRSWFWRYSKLKSQWYSLQDIPVELLLSIAQKFPDHLPAEALPLKKEVSHADRRVGDEPSLGQVLDAFFWLPESST